MISNQTGVFDDRTILWKELVGISTLLIQSCCTLDSGVIKYYQAPNLVYGSGIARNLGCQFRTYDSDLQVAV